MELDLNSTGDMTYGTTDIVRLYYNDEIIWRKYYNQYFTIEPLTNVVFSCTKDIYYKNYNYSNWIHLPAGTSAAISAGNKYKIYANFTYDINLENYNQFTVSGNFNVYGNIMSLINGTNFIGTSNLDRDIFAKLFKDCTGLVSAQNLILPNTTESYCYEWMFSGCTSLTATPELPALTLSAGCYHGMFYGCTSLINAPALPATEVTDMCYYMMFSGCTSLTTAPELRATRLWYYCYTEMFDGCHSLNYVKCLATNPTYEGTTIYTNYWLSNVASTGTFVKKAGVTWPTGNIGMSGIPSGWTVINV